METVMFLFIYTNPRNGLCKYFANRWLKWFHCQNLKQSKTSQNAFFFEFEKDYLNYIDNFHAMNIKDTMIEKVWVHT